MISYRHLTTPAAKVRQTLPPFTPSERIGLGALLHPGHAWGLRLDQSSGVFRD